MHKKLSILYSPIYVWIRLCIIHVHADIGSQGRTVVA